MESADQPIQDLHKGVASSLSVNPQSLKPEDHQPLDTINEILKDAGYAAETTVGDESKVIRSASGNSWRQRLQERFLGHTKEQKAA